MPKDVRYERWALGILILGISAFLAIRLPLLSIRVFDPDEFEHSHAAWCVSKGLLPYRDFFEHHTPWYYLSLAPFFRWFRVDESFETARRFLLFARLTSLALSAGVVMLLSSIGSSLANRRVGLMTGLLIAGQQVLARKMEIRPDVPALLFFCGGLCLLLDAIGESERQSPVRYWRYFLAGFCLGSATMYTQKMLFALPGVLLGLLLWAIKERRREFRTRFVSTLIVSAGIALPPLLTWLLFALRGGGQSFLFNNFVLNAQWRQFSDRHLTEVLRDSWLVVIFGLLGIGLRVGQSIRAKSKDYRLVLLLCVLSSLVVGLAIVPAAYEQYYLPILAILCLFAADGIVLCVELASPTLQTALMILSAATFSISPASELSAAFSRTATQQMARLQYVFDHTSPSQTVLDGWLGTGVFRPHALYYFFVHRELWASLRESERQRYFAALEGAVVKPSLIALDRELGHLGPRLARFLQRDYEAANGVFFVRVRSTE